MTLSETNEAARRAHMTYGQYVAAHWDGKPVKRKVEIWIDEMVEQISKPCKVCGKPFIPSRSNQLMCSYECRKNAKNCARNERRRRKRVAA